MADTMPRVTASWIGCTEPSRDRTSPRCRFSKNSAGRRADHLEAQKLAEDFQRIVAQRLDAGLHQHQCAEPQRQYGEQIGIGPEDRVVNHELQLERGGERCYLQGE